MGGYISSLNKFGNCATGISLIYLEGKKKEKTLRYFSRINVGR